MTDTFTKEDLFKFTYSKKSHFDFFKDFNSEVELYGKNFIPDKDADLIAYQNLLVYSYLKNKKGMNILQIGLENMKSFEKLLETHHCWKIEIEDLINENGQMNFMDFSENVETKIPFAKSFFDFVFLSTSINNISSDSKVIKKIFSNIKYILKSNGIFVCSFINIISEKSFWVNEMIPFFKPDNVESNNGVSFNVIHQDSDLFVLSEFYYKNFWEKHTKKSYQEFGKPYCYNIFFENKEYIHPENFQNFSFSKKSHFSFYKNNGYLDELGISISENDFGLDENQSLLVFTMIKSNFIKNSKILQIGKAPICLENKLNVDYDFYKLENIELLFQTTNLFGECFNKEIKNNSESKISEFNNFFDFIYFFPEYSEYELNFIQHTNVYMNLNNLLKLWGLSLVSAKSIVSDNNIFYPNLFNYLFFNNLIKFTKYIEPSKILSDSDVYFTDESKSVEITQNKINEDTSLLNGEILYNILWRKIAFLPTSSKTKSNNRLKEYPVYVFHHLMKCGGTSLFHILDKWFKTIDDNIFEEDLNSYVLKKYNTSIFHNDICLRAHFQRDGIFIHERYPELLEDKSKYRVFIFIRDPLSIKISKYYYLKSVMKVKYKLDLKDSLLKDDNFIASLIPCDDSNYKEMMDRYFFVGIFERLQESFDVFANLIGKKKEIIPFLNKSEKDSQVSKLSPEFLKKFREQNKLDYKIYDYSMEKFEKLLQNKDSL